MIERRRTLPLRSIWPTLLTLVVLTMFGQVAPAGAATGNQQAAMSAINQYLNSFQSLTGDFVQFGPDGSRIEGTFALLRPGRIHFVYANPAQIDVVSDGKSVAVRDTRRKTQDLWPLKRTPLRFLLSPNIDLAATTNVTDVNVADDIITVVVKESTLFGEGTLTMVFDSRTTELRQWTVTDSQGQDTTVAIYNVKKNARVDPGRFKIKYLKERPLGSNK